MFEGIYLWDAKYGVPNSTELADRVDFVEQLEEKENEVNHNIHGFTVFFDKFLTEAYEHYEDEPAITQNAGMSEYDKNKAVPVLFYLEESPNEAYDYFWLALRKGAQLNNLVIYDTNSNILELPSENNVADTELTEWKNHLATLKKDINSEVNTDSTEANEPLPETKSKIKKLMANILKERLTELGMEKFKVKSSSQVEVVINSDEVKLDLTIFFELDEDLKWDENKIRIWIRPLLYIHISGLRDYLNVGFFHFNRIPYDWKIHEEQYLSSQNIAELKSNLEKGIEMLLYIYPHINNAKSMYDFLSQAKEDKHLSRHYFGTVQHIDQRYLYDLARLTKQQNLPELHDRLKQEYIDDWLFMIEEDRKSHDIKQAELVKKGYNEQPFWMPENPEEFYAKEFDDYVAGLTQAE